MATKRKLTANENIQNKQARTEGKMKVLIIGLYEANGRDNYIGLAEKEERLVRPITSVEDPTWAPGTLHVGEWVEFTIGTAGAMTQFKEDLVVRAEFRFLEGRSLKEVFCSLGLFSILKDFSDLDNMVAKLELEAPNHEFVEWPRKSGRRASVTLVEPPSFFVFKVRGKRRVHTWMPNQSDQSDGKVIQLKVIQ